MPISPATISRRRGFTFIEVMVVIALLAVLMALTVPAFLSMVEGVRTREVNRLTSVLRLLRSEAILTRKTFRLQLDLNEHAYWAEGRDGNGKFQPLSQPRSFRVHRLPEVLRFQDVVIYGSAAGKLEDRIVPITIDSSGFIDPFLLHFSEGRHDWTLRVSGFSGHTETLEGYSNDLRR